MRPGARSRSVCWPIARTSPTSSSAGGRSPCTRRRSSVSMPPTSSRASASIRSDSSGDRAAVIRAVSIREATAARVGPEPVVQVAAEPAALVLDGGDHPLAAALELGGELPGPGRGGGLAHDVGEQPLVGGAEPGAASAVAGEQQPADPLAPVGDRQGPGVGGTVAVLGDEQLPADLPDLDADVRRPERLRHRPRHLEQLRVGGGESSSRSASTATTR